MKINKLKEYRENLKLTQSELAKKVGVTQQQISAYESGKDSPSLFVAMEISKILNKKVDEIFLSKNTIKTCKID